MTDADVFAFQGEFDEMDEWEIMNAHAIEAAEEDLRAIDSSHQQQARASQQQPEIAQHTRNNGNVVENLEDNLQKAQSRLDHVLARCATLLGEEGDEDVAMENAPTRFEHAGQKKKQMAASSIDRITAEYLYSRPPIDVDSLSVVLNDGKRLFLRKKRPNFLNVTSNSSRSVAVSIMNIKTMMDAAEQIEIEEVMKRENEAMLLAHKISASKDASSMSNVVLWLDKYRPQSFLDLLSDERTNREVLTWIKSWDQYVFPKKGFSNSAPPISSPAKKIGASGNSSWKQTTRLVNANRSTEAEDVEDKRPQIKVILISGPPGAGKTTLANIVARHSGYNPIEVNASDDRTASVLREKIISAMEMQSIWTERKPNCIILDEIDGAMNGSDGKSAIEAVCEIAKAPLQKKKAGTKAVTKNSHPLTRPIICICNDLYASVLRPLRQLAKIFVLDAPHQQRLVTRLKYICRLEGIKASTTSLSTLCANAGNDVRYCLNALQFQSTQLRKANSSVVALSAGAVAQKDHVHSMFEALDIVFYERRSNYVKGELPAAEKITDAVASLGNLPLLLNGLDENVPKLIFNDPTMSKICEVFEWLGLADEYENRARAQQQYAFQSYIPFAAIAAHASCCTSSKRRLEYPRIQFEVQRRSSRSENILVAFTEGAQLQPILRHGTSVLVLDVVPWIVASLSPKIRRINPALQTKEEKAMIQRLIELMASLGLSFRHKYLPDGTEVYALEPPLNELVEFRGNEASQPVLPLTVRKMIAREVELEQMRRNEISVSSKRPNHRTQSSSVTVDKSIKAVLEEKAAKNTDILPNLSQAEQAKKVEVSRMRNPFAFAHREAKRKRAEELNAKVKQQRTDSGRGHSMVRYKFNEGYTCGIKTAVYVRDLL